MISVIIATDNRADALLDCLNSLKDQSFLPDEIIISHGGSDQATKDLVDKLKIENFKIKIVYFNFGPLGAAIQRNRGAEQSSGDIIFFLDDDVVCEKDFIKGIIRIFLRDTQNTIGGISGTIVNQTYVPLSKLNRKLFELCLSRGEIKDEYGGKVVGPAVNFLPLDKPDLVQRVDWLPSVCCAYRRSVFLKNKFNDKFYGYSFMEDVECSCRIAKKYQLINTANARVYHKDLGGKTNKKWIQIGKMQVLNRWQVMKVLNKESAEDMVRFFYYQIYCMISEIKFLFDLCKSKDTLLRWIGRFIGCLELLKGPIKSYQS